jgi:DNA-binding SARP family transcriptional activator
VSSEILHRTGLSDIHFGVLGPLEVQIGAAPCPLGPFKQRVVLALLLCNANSIVPVELLAEALWGDDLPRTAYKNLQVYISTLRRILFSGNGQARLAYRIRGYQIELNTSELDALLFNDLAHQGRMALRDGAVASAARTLEAALAMWRGDALMDLRGVPAIEAEAVRLENRRLSVYEDWVEAELAIGNHAHVLDAIEDMVRRHPMRERLRTAQFVALNRCGRRAEALAEYEELRQLLSRELGLQPSPAMARLYQAILGDDPVLDAPGTSGPVRLFADTTAHLSQLTRDLADFTGREEFTGRLVSAVQAESRQVQVTVISGPPGVGKTALAVHAGHLLMTERADGQILVRLRSASGLPRPASGILGELLRSFGLGSRLPRGLEERAALYRSWLAERKMLIILDDAVDEAQVRPLLPGTGECDVLVSSRRHLGGLEAADHVTLQPFEVAEAVALLAKVAGGDRVRQSPEAAERIAVACGMMPLAIRIIGAKLNAEPRATLADLAARLEDERYLLDELSVGDLTIRACAAEYERELAGRDTASFLRLGMLPASRFTLDDFAAALNGSGHEAEAVLDRLVAANVVSNMTPADADGQQVFSIPRWLQLYARERLRASS